MVELCQFVMLYRRVSKDEEFSIICAAEPPDPEESVKWLYKSAIVGHVRAQYQLALCLHQGRGINHNIQEAVRSLIFK